jgi:hypothetical protein
MIKVQTISGKSITLEYAQSYLTYGKTRFTLNDFSTLRVKSLGGKLSPLVIEGYYIVNDVTQIYEFLNFFLKQKEPPGIPFPSRMEQCIISISPSESGADYLKDNIGTITFRGTINEVKLDFNIKQNRFCNYFIKFLVSPYDSSDNNIRQVYWVM